MVNLSLREIFELAEKNERNGIEIQYVWVKKCQVCSDDIHELDEEYSFSFDSKKPIKFDEIKKAFDEFCENYEIYDNLFEEDLELFTWICFNETDNKETYCYFNEIDDSFARCNFCEFE